MKNLFVRFVREDAGQDLIEYRCSRRSSPLVRSWRWVSVGDEIDTVFADVVTGLQTR